MKEKDWRWAKRNEWEALSDARLVHVQTSALAMRNSAISVSSILYRNDAT